MPDLGEVSAFDGKAIHSYANGKSRKESVSKPLEEVIVRPPGMCKNIKGDVLMGAYGKL